MIRRDRQDERNAIRKELQAFDATRERMREQVVTMKSKLRFTTIEAVDREIARLEETHAHTTMSLNDEKKLIAQIKAAPQLTKPRLLAEDLQQQMVESIADRSSPPDIRM